MAPDVFFPILYLVISVFVAGTCWEMHSREHDGEVDFFEDGPEILFPSFFWGLIVAFLVAIGTVWLLSWIPRGPARLILWIMDGQSKPDLPEARVV